MRETIGRRDSPRLICKRFRIAKRYLRLFQAYTVTYSTVHFIHPSIFRDALMALGAYGYTRICHEHSPWQKT